MGLDQNASDGQATDAQLLAILEGARRWHQLGARGDAIGGIQHDRESLLAGALLDKLPHLPMPINGNARCVGDHRLVAEPMVPMHMGVEDRE